MKYAINHLFAAKLLEVSVTTACVGSVFYFFGFSIFSTFFAMASITRFFWLSTSGF